MEAKISEAEWMVMEVLWQRREASSADVIASLEQHAEWHPKTVQTLLGRLVKKRFVTYQAERGRYLYRPAVARRRVVEEAGRRFLDRVFAGDAASLLMHFARDAALTEEQTTTLRDLLDQIEGDAT